MSDTNDTTKKPAGGRTPLTLKKVETSTVKQSFSHGRTKAVVVEKKRTLGPTAPVAKPAAPSAKPSAPAPAASAPSAPAAAPAPRGVVLRQLTEEEKARRGAALADARVHETEARKRAEDEARLRAAEDERLKIERLAAEKRKSEEDARKAAEAEARRHAEEEVARREHRPEGAAGAAAPAGTAAAAAAAAATPAGARVRRPVEEEEEEATTKKGTKVPAKAAPAAKKIGDDSRRRGKLTVTKALSGDDERMRSVASYRRHLQRVKGVQSAPAGPAGPREVVIPETITVSELANRMERRSVDIIKVLMKNGHMATANDVIDADTA